MPSTESSIPNQRLWAGRIMSGLPALFLLMDGSMKLYKPRFVVEATVQMGYPESAIVGIGVALLLSTLLYLLPRTSILGAVLLTGYLGGAVASQVRVSAVPFNLVYRLGDPQPNVLPEILTPTRVLAAFHTPAS